MRPNTPHVVYTTKDTICHGGYFYVTAAMQDTMFGIVHGFIAGCVLTNTDKPGSFLILRRIAMFYHDVLVTKRLQDDGRHYLLATCFHPTDCAFHQNTRRDMFPP
jgi:hypothetical protein